MYTCKIFLICVSLLIHLKESKPILSCLLFGGFNDFMSKKSPVLLCSVFTRYSVLNMVMQRYALWKFLKTFRKLDHITKCSKNVWYEKETGDHWFYKAICPVFFLRGSARLTAVWGLPRVLSEADTIQGMASG